MGNESFPIHAPFIIGQSWGMIPWAIHAPFSFPIHWEFCSLPIHGESPWPIQGPVYCHGPFMGLGACAVVSNPLIGLIVGSETDTILYDCVAVCNHFGSCKGGHYTAHALRGSTWFCFDDAKKTVEIKSPQENIGENNSSAYMLFYERRPFITVHSASGVASV